jgi:hypothetical protein
MAINWNSGGNRFSFGNLSAPEQSQFEDNPGLAFQMLQNWYGQGNPNFGATTFGRYIASQQSRLNNDYLARAGAQAARLAQDKQAWQSRWQSQWQSQWQPPANQPLDWTAPNGKTYYLQTGDYYDLQGKKYTAPAYIAPAYTAPEEQLTWTKYLEQNGVSAGDLVGQFNQLTASQRGANPGSFAVKRNLW